MKISELAEKTGLKAINEYADRDVEGVYISDMVSDIITSAKRNSVLITLQTHKSLVAAANLVAAAMIVIVKGRKPSDDVVELAATRTGSRSSSPIATRGRWPGNSRHWDLSRSRDGSLSRFRRGSSATRAVGSPRSSA